ncbi:MAG: CDP-diacylglycerol--glycerol-3-phosphate 3-phosphatidyltransferase [Planctomycetaceae bacterium]
MPQSEKTSASPLTHANAPAPIDARSLNLPNLITSSRLLLSFVLFAMIYAEGHWFSEPIKGYWLWAAFLFAFSAATDAVDGYVARKYGQVTTLGRILDPFVDKIIICSTFVFLLEKKDVSGVNAWMVIAVVGREMFVTGLRAFLEQSGKDFSAVWIGKVKMMLQCAAVMGSLLTISPALRSNGWLLTRDCLLWAAVGITVYSGVSYAWRGFQMLRPQKETA